jgi:hypothetical protein
MDIIKKYFYNFIEIIQVIVIFMVHMWVAINLISGFNPFNFSVNDRIEHYYFLQVQKDGPWDHQKLSILIVSFLSVSIIFSIYFKDRELFIEPLTNNEKLQFVICLYSVIIFIILLSHLTGYIIINMIGINYFNDHIKIIWEYQLNTYYNFINFSRWYII